jgi:hypothetical protein
MKNRFFTCALAIMAALTMSVNAAQRGKFIHVDNTVNKNLKPQIAFCQAHKDGKEVTTLLVKTVNTNAYNEFTDASRVLIRFADGKAIRLNRLSSVEVQKNKYSKKNGNATISYYETITEYETLPDVIEKLEAGIAIIKVRIVFKENDAKDYDIVENYQPKMAADLLKSYQEAAMAERKSNTDLSDDDF